MPNADTPLVNYRTPRAFVQFIGENDEVYNLAPENILSIQTTKSLSSMAGSFEIQFKSGATKEASSTGPIYRSPAPSLDWWMDRIHPMTLVIIAVGAQADVTRVQKLLTPEVRGTDKASRTATIPKEFMKSLQTDERAADRTAVERSILMIGLVEDCSLSVSVGTNGPQRSLRVAGRDMGKILLDDNLTRMARARAQSREQEMRMIAVGDVSPDEYRRFMDRASINSSDNAQFWKTMSLMGSDSKIPLLEAITNIVNRAPSYNIQLSNSRRLQDYFDVGAVTLSENRRTADLTTSRVVISPELKLMSVRATMTLLLAQGPVASCLLTFAPPPLAEMFVETYGLEARLVVRRPPFYRPANMPKLVESMSAFMRQARRDAGGIDTIESAYRGLIDGQIDEFATSDPNARYGVRGVVHTIEAYQVLSYLVSRTMSNAVSIYQVYPTVLMRGEAGESAAQQGVFSFLYDLAAAQRYGTTKTYRYGCPWDLMREQAAAGANVGIRRVTAVSADFRVTPEANGDKRVTVVRPTVGTTELSLACAETMRQYYYNRENPAYLSGQITVVGSTDYRIGDRVRLPDHDDLVFYVESVQQSYQYGRGFVTSLSVSRGQPFNLPTRRLVPYTDTLEPVVATNRVGIRSARDPWTPPRG